MLIGSRSGFVTFEDSEEEMYKELLTQILSNTLPADSVLDITMSDIRKYALAQQSNLKTLIIRGVTALTSRNEYFVQGSAVETVELPDLLSCNHFVFWSTPTLKVLRVPKLKTNMTGICYIGTSALTDVYVDESTCAEIMAIPGFPGMTTAQNSNYANIVFHGSDGTISYDGSAWVITQNSNVGVVVVVVGGGGGGGGGGGHKCLICRFSPFSRSSRLLKEAA